MYRFETLLFFSMAAWFTVYLASAFVCELLNTADEYVLFARTIAPRLVISSFWFFFVHYSASFFAGNGLNVWVVAGYLVILSEFASLWKVVSSTARKCSGMKGYYLAFETSVLMSERELSQEDFTQSVKSVIERKLSHDDNCAFYFASKCRKFALSHGLEWEE